MASVEEDCKQDGAETLPPSPSAPVPKGTSSSTSCSLASPEVTISDLPDEILVYHILPLLSIEEIGPVKGVCKKWRGFVRQYFRHMKRLDLTPWDFLVDEKLLVDIVKYAVNLKQLRLV